MMSGVEWTPAGEARIVREIQALKNGKSDLERILDDIYSIIESESTRKLRRATDYEPNEQGQVQCMVDLVCGYIRYSDGIGWAVFDQQKGGYRAEYGEAVLFNLLTYFGQERWNFRHTGGNKEVLTYAKAALTRHGQVAVSESLRYRPGIFSIADEYDANPYLINCWGTTFDLRTGKARLSVPEHMHTRSTNAVPADSPHCPKFRAFLNEITLGRDDVVKFIMRWFGYCLTGNMDAQVFVNFHGAGGNGKGTLLHVMEHIFGDYAMTIPEVVVLDKGNSMETKVAQANAEMRGIRLGVAPDVKQGKLNMSNVKQITGKDKISAEQKYRDPYSYYPQIKLTISTNERLSLPSTGDDIKRRLRFVPFDYKLTAQTKNEKLEDELRAESGGILRWLIGEAREYINEGLTSCAVINAASDEYIRDEDALQRFLEERTVIEDGAQVQSSVLYNAFVSWGEANGIKRPVSQTLFSERIVKKGFKKITTRNGVFFIDVKVR
jgi:putative DNA primase/helicase